MFRTPFIKLIWGLVVISPFLAGGQTITPATALDSYLRNGDTTFSWVVQDSLQVPQGTIYDLELTSQKWREGVWKHQLTVLVPAAVKYEDALLFITGGSIKAGSVNKKGMTDELTRAMGLLAIRNQCVVAILRQVPNQPLYNDLREDALISYTLHQFKETGDYTWPLLFPMVKSATRAMDAVQAFTATRLPVGIRHFVVTGASKRGWTTWLTGAFDTRVMAIAPMVIDVLNMPVSLQYQIEAWKDYSPQIQDYVNLGIPQQAHTESGRQLVEMVDPYTYRRRLTMPKMLLLGTNDPYWPVDAVKNYLDSIPGENYLDNVPNAGHDLGDQREAFATLGAFVGYTLQHKTYPRCDWTVTTTGTNVQVAVQATAGQLAGVQVWSAAAPVQDFRQQQWTARDVQWSGNSIQVTETIPAQGYKAFYVRLTYKDLTGGQFTQSTRVFVMDRKGVVK